MRKKWLILTLALAAALFVGISAPSKRGAASVESSATIARVASGTAATGTGVTSANSTRTVTSTPAHAAPSPTAPDSARLEPELVQLGHLSRILVDTPEKRAATRRLLAQPELPRKISAALNDPSTYAGGEAFTRKLRLLDALYEGLKFPEADIHNTYSSLAGDLLRAPPPEGFDAAQRRQFLADRVEVALTLLKQFPRASEHLEAQVGESGAAAFAAARRLKDTYEVAL